MYNLYFLRFQVLCNGGVTGGVNIAAHNSGNKSCIDDYGSIYYECVNGNILCFNHADLILWLENIELNSQIILHVNW